MISVALAILLITLGCGSKADVSQDTFHTPLPKSLAPMGHTIQVGAFTERENALRLRASLSRKYREAKIKVFDQGSQRFYRVRVGQYSRLNEAEAAAERLQEKDFPNAFAVASDR